EVEGAPAGAAGVAAGGLELEAGGPQVGKHGAGDPAEPVRRVDDQDARQQHGATLSTRHARGRSASKTRVNALMTRASILFPTRSFYEGRWIAGSSPAMTTIAWHRSAPRTGERVDPA